MSQYIGKTISLVSNKGLRYVGLLDKISAEDATVSLKSVRSFGTEGRMAEQGQPNLEVSPGTDIYEYVVFRGSDVKDLSVLDIPIDEVRPVVYYPPQMPAGSPTTAQNYAAGPGPTPVPPQGNTSVPAETTASRDTAPETTEAAPAPTDSGVARETATAYNEKPATSASASVTATETPTKTATAEAPTPASRPEPAYRRNPAPRAQQGPQQDLSTEFDFEEANRRFEKEKENSQNASSNTPYDKKSSFFDTISSNEHQGNSMRWHEEKNLNMDTFGEAYASRGRGRGGYRGNYRGRGNGYRGRGRGNYRGRGSSEPKPEWA